MIDPEFPTGHGLSKEFDVTDEGKDGRDKKGKEGAEERDDAVKVGQQEDEAGEHECGQTDAGQCTESVRQNGLPAQEDRVERQAVFRNRVQRDPADGETIERLVVVGDGHQVECDFLQRGRAKHEVAGHGHRQVDGRDGQISRVDHPLVFLWVLHVVINGRKDGVSGKAGHDEPKAQGYIQPSGG